METVLVTGGAGYVGSVLVPKLLADGFKVIVLDLMLYGETSIKEDKNLEIIKGDICDRDLIRKLTIKSDHIIHLAFITDNSGKQSLESIKKKVNEDAFRHLYDIAIEEKIKRFIFASTTSVYGKCDKFMIDEESPTKPLSDYADAKLKCEKYMMKKDSGDMDWIIVRPSTICGYSERQRFDLSVNMMVNYAYHKRKIPVLKPHSIRPSVNIKTMVEFYSCLLHQDKRSIGKEIFNISYDNNTVLQSATMIKKIIGNDVELETKSFDDGRTYSISNEKIRKKLGFEPKFLMEDAVVELIEYFEKGIFEDTFGEMRYYNRPMKY